MFPLPKIWIKYFNPEQQYQISRSLPPPEPSQKLLTFPCHEIVAVRMKMFLKLFPTQRVPIIRYSGGSFHKLSEKGFEMLYTDPRQKFSDHKIMTFLSFSGRELEDTFGSPNQPYMCKNAKMCYFQHFLGVPLSFPTKLPIRNFSLLPSR